MAETENLTVEILKQIRDEIRTTREELSARIDATREELSARIDATREELSARIDLTNERLGLVENTLVDLATQQRFLVRNARRSAQHEASTQREIEDLKRRVTAVEERLPPKTP